MIVSVSFIPAPRQHLRCCPQSTEARIRPSSERTSRSGLLAASVQFSWPPAFRFLAAPVQDPMAADSVAKTARYQDALGVVAGTLPSGGERLNWTGTAHLVPSSTSLAVDVFIEGALVGEVEDPASLEL